MKLQKVLTFIFAFILIVGSGLFVIYIKQQEKLLAKDTEKILEKIKNTKAEAKRINSELKKINNEEVSTKISLKTSSLIEECLEDGTCLFQLRGAATTDPTMTFIILNEKWRLFEDSDKNILRKMLKDEIQKASLNPELYTNIPRSAPFYPRAINNIKKSKSYSVILSHRLSSEGKLYIDETILKNF